MSYRNRVTQVRTTEPAPATAIAEGLEPLFTEAARLAATYRASLSDPPVRAVALPSGAFGTDLPASGTPAADVLAELAQTATPALQPTAGPRFFGFVTGSALPAASAADMLAVGWDQNGFTPAMTPAGAEVEATVSRWVRQLFGLPVDASVGLVTGTQAANTTGLACGRHRVLAAVGHDVEADGLIGAPRLRIVASVERHATIDRSARLIGLGTNSIVEVSARADGSMDMDSLATVLAAEPSTPTIVCLQAGNVNTGAVDDLRRGVELARAVGGWVHVDGAFGLFAAASPATAHLTDGLELADSWGCDGHKWLNTPHDCGFAMVADAELHGQVMSYQASYLTGASRASGMGAYTPESSRRARGFAAWAALRELGRDGVAALVDRCCANARRFATALGEAGFEIGNDVVLNQVLVSFGSDELTDAVIEGVQTGGVCWMGGTTWHGRRWMRVSVSSYLTSGRDVDLSVAEIIRVAAAQRPLR